MEIPKESDIISVDLQQCPRTKVIDLVVTKCPGCGNKHSHGSGEGWRVSHCFNKKTYRSYSVSYYLKIDWTIPKHAALKSHYKKLLHEAGVTE